jgi:hypothetical protein
MNRNGGNKMEMNGGRRRGVIRKSFVIRKRIL